MKFISEVKVKNYYDTALELKKHIPELTKLSTDDIVMSLRGSGLFVVEKKTNNTTGLGSFYIAFCTYISCVIIMFFTF